MALARRFGSVDVPVDVNRRRRHSPERQMVEGQRRLAGLHGGDVHRLEAGVVQPFGVVVMVSEHPDSLAWTVPHVEH